MQFTNLVRVLPLCLAFLIVAGCANVTQVFDPETEHNPAITPQSQAKPLVESSSEAQPSEPLTPLQQKVLELRSKPNLYLAGRSELSLHIQQQFRLAHQAVAQNQADKATEIFAQLTQAHPKLSGPWVGLGDISMNALDNAELGTQQYDALLAKAKNAYQKAVLLNHLNYHAQNRLAKVYRLEGQFALAQQHYQKALDSWPAFDAAILNLAILHDLYLGNKQQALTHYNLYQAMQSSQNRQVNGWIVDLERQISRQVLEAQR